jgi:hypothetical protein
MPAFAQRGEASETWRFDNLTSIGGYETQVEGKPRLIDTPQGKAIEFNGADDALFIENHPLAGAERFTAEVIFLPASMGRAEQRFFHMQENGSQTRLLFETRLTGGSWYLDSFANTPAGSRPLIDRNLLHPLDRWYHIAMVYDGKVFRHYVNGALQGEAEVRLSPQGPGRTSVGVRMNRVDYFKGAARLARFSKRALTVSEFLTAEAK